MTTETIMPGNISSGRIKSIGKLPLGGMLAVVAIWFLGMGVAAAIVQPDAVIGFGPPGRMIPAIVESDGALLNATRFTVAARTGHNTVRSLYAAGAWFVWPVIAKGCGRS